jgi:hypothetical protein
MVNVEHSIGCPMCGGALHVGEEVCPHCRATPQWQDFARAINFSRKQIAAWRESDFLSSEQHSLLDQPLLIARQEAIEAVGNNRPFPPNTGLSSPVACWRCGRGVGRINADCNTCGAPLGEKADELRFIAFLRYQIDQAAQADTELTDLNRCKSDLESQATLIRNQLETARLGDEGINEARLMAPGTAWRHTGGLFITATQTRSTELILRTRRAVSSARFELAFCRTANLATARANRGYTASTISPTELSCIGPPRKAPRARKQLTSRELFPTERDSME